MLGVLDVLGVLDAGDDVFDLGPLNPIVVRTLAGPTVIVKGRSWFKAVDTAVLAAVFTRGLVSFAAAVAVADLALGIGKNVSH